MVWAPQQWEFWSMKNSRITSVFRSPKFKFGNISWKDYVIRFSLIMAIQELVELFRIWCTTFKTNSIEPFESDNVWFRISLNFTSWIDLHKGMDLRNVKSLHVHYSLCLRAMNMHTPHADMYMTWQLYCIAVCRARTP